MIGVIGSLLALFALAPDADTQFLNGRVKDLRVLYRDLASSQAVASVRQRRTVIRELGHIPWKGPSRVGAGKLLAEIVTTDRAYGVRAAAARAIGEVGTAPALHALYRALFGPAARQGPFEHLDWVLPDAVARLKRADDLAWISRHVLQPAATRKWTAVLRAAGPVRYRAIAATLRGLARAQARAVVPEILTLARSPRPSVRVAALKALGGLGHWDPVFEKAAEDPVADVRAAAAGNPHLPVYLADRMLRDSEAMVRRAAIDALAKRPPKEAVPRLIDQLAREKDEVLRLDIAEHLVALTKKDFGRDEGLWRQWWAAQQDGDKGKRPQAQDSERVYFFGVGFRTRRVLFLIDTSGSMAQADVRGRTRLRRAAAQFGKAIRALDSHARFRVIGFSAGLREFPGRTKPAAWETSAFANKAVAWLARLKPAGTTNTYGALMAAFESSFKPDTIVLLSDGRPYRCLWKGKTYERAEQILAEVQRANAKRAIRIHTIALLDGAATTDLAEDEDTAADFLRRLAQENRGTSRELR